MKKVILGIAIGLVLVIGGCAAFIGAGVSSVDQAIKETETQMANTDTLVKEMAQNISWEVKKTDYSTSIVGVFENTSEEVIDYVEFEYKLFDGEGTVLESSFTNETNVNPGEKRKVEILCIENDFDKYEITAKSSAL